MPCVYLASEVVKGLLMGFARRFDVQALARGEFDPWHDKMQLMVLCVGVPNPQAHPLILFQASECDLLKAVHGFFFLLRCHCFASFPRQNAGGVFVLERQ